MIARHGDMGPSCCLHQQLAAHQRGAESARTGLGFPPLHTSQVVQAFPPSLSALCTYSSSGAQAGPARHGHVHAWQQPQATAWDGLIKLSEEPALNRDLLCGVCLMPALCCLDK